MLMSKVFQVKPKRLKRSNGTVLTPDMVVTVTTMQHTATPFYNGAKEVQEAYMRIYAFDYKKACCNPNDLYGSDSNNHAAHRHPFLQWSQGGAGSLHAHLCFRL